MTVETDSKTETSTTPDMTGAPRALRPNDFALLARRVRATGDAEPIAVHNPFDGAPIGAVPRCRPEDVLAAAARARAAQPAWAALSYRARGRVLARFHDLLLRRQSEILDIIQLENGKTRIQAFEEVMGTANAAAHYAYAARSYLRPRRRAGAMPLLTSTREIRRPRGLVGFITPWNYPLTMGMTDALAALAAGNAVLIKPDHQTPYSVMWAVGLLEQAGLPPDVATVVTGDGPELGPPIVESVDYLMFTGSTRVGRLLAARAGERLIECSMELGGKNAMLVLKDADLDRTVRGAVTGSFSNAGQLCIAMERIYVHRSLHDEFVERFAQRVGQLRLGGGLDWGSDVGPLISAQQLERVTAHVEDAVENGATVRAGGRARPDVGPLFFEPTVLTGVTAKATCFAEETFGPVVSVYEFDDLDSAIEQINDVSYGLNASVWTRDARSGARIAARIEAGTVNVNEPYAAAFGSTAAPMGGMKQSGMGRRHGAYGIQKYTESQTIAVQRLLPVSPPMDWNGQLYARAMTSVLALKRRTPFLR
ncbi:MAG: succinate-semialdehyde dehydrogenase (NADP(+)) [Actinobacteria bacterium]|nr:succinate-semialdehyde dehydrogenase (NADP(+)) [Actinomycetota bacterium]